MFRFCVAGMTLLVLALVTGCTSDGRAVPASSHRGHGQVAASHPGRSPVASTSPPDEHPAPYIARAVWVSRSGGRSLQIYPTANGRVTTADGAQDAAWHEVLRKQPDADTAGMRAQFDCHWVFARIAQPDKPSWNIEPWRPVVSGQRMYDTRCNPGGPEV